MLRMFGFSLMPATDWLAVSGRAVGIDPRDCCAIGSECEKLAARDSVAGSEIECALLNPMRVRQIAMISAALPLASLDLRVLLARDSG